ncbi:glycoside hydrolase family 75 protein [Streptomyces sp. NRRL B-3648]|uniref:glycoside hydrolase family 75 protein n=1 Tax=Streptomyces sp. NRRL B-3648 TaxID=1519493 RepID=UPI0006AD8B12|nr:glycoside hydrolase family 75 protein [Streptomyces sp. NRRL B-3648]
MRFPSLTLAAAGAALLAPAALPAAATALPATALPPRERLVAGGEGAVSAADLLARTGTCTELSKGRYRTDADGPATVPVCGTRDAVFWKADMDIDCDGRPTTHCNSSTDPMFAAITAFQQSDGRELSAETLPYVVVPAPSARWDYRAYGVRGGSVVAVVHGDRVQYAVVGDTGPSDLIGEASYAAAAGLGIDPDPQVGGVPSDVTYIVFRDSRVSPIEDHAAAVTEGERLARLFVTGD